MVSTAVYNVDTCQICFEGVTCKNVMSVSVIIWHNTSCLNMFHMHVSKTLQQCVL